MSNPPDFPFPPPDPATDIPLFNSSRFSSYTFAPVRSGTDICAQGRPGGPVRFYLSHWSSRPDQKNECTVITEDCVIRILRALAVMPDTLTGMEFINILHYLPKYFEGKERSHGIIYVHQDDSCGEYVEYFRRGPDVEMM